MKGALPWILLVAVLAAGVALYIRGDTVSKELRAQIRVKEQEHSEALVLTDSLQREVASADSLAESIERTLTQDLERSQAEVVQLRSSADSILARIEELREEIPPHVYELLQSLQKTHEYEVAEYHRQLVLKDQMMAWKDFQIQERDRYIQGLRASEARAHELIALQDEALNPSFSVKLKNAVPTILTTAAVTTGAVLLVVN